MIRELMRINENEVVATDIDGYMDISKYNNFIEDECNLENELEILDDMLNANLNDIVEKNDLKGFLKLYKKQRIAFSFIYFGLYLFLFKIEALLFFIVSLILLGYVVKKSNNLEHEVNGLKSQNQLINDMIEKISLNLDKKENTHTLEINQLITLKTELSEEKQRRLEESYTNGYNKSLKLRKSKKN